MIDIKERLRKKPPVFLSEISVLMKEAADHIATLEASVAANQKEIQRLNSAASALANSHIRRVAERNLLSFLKHSNLDDSNLRSAFSCVGVLADTSTQEVG